LGRMHPLSIRCARLLSSTVGLPLIVTAVVG
jgi:hypothetical protein